MKPNKRNKSKKVRTKNGKVTQPMVSNEDIGQIADKMQIKAQVEQLVGQWISVFGGVLQALGQTKSLQATIIQQQLQNQQQQEADEKFKKLEQQIEQLQKLNEKLKNKQ